MGLKLILLAVILILLTKYLHFSSISLYQPFISGIQTTGSYVPQSYQESIGLQWSALPTQSLLFMIREFGQPDLINLDRGGLAIWTSKTLSHRGFCWSQVIIRDQKSNWIEIHFAIPPKVKIPQKLYKLLIDLHAPIDYHQHRLIAYGHSLQYVIMLLYVGKKLIFEELNANQVKNLISGFSQLPRQSYDRFKIELCSVGQPHINELGENPSMKIFNLSSGVETPISHLLYDPLLVDKLD